MDQNRQDNNVYLLDQVSVNDLQNIAEANEYDFSLKASVADSNGNLLSQLQGNVNENIDDITEGENPNPSAPKTKASPIATTGKNTVIILILAAIGGGIFYYFRVMKNKKDTQMDEVDDAMDMDEFEADDGSESNEDEPEDEDFFEYEDPGMESEDDSNDEDGVVADSEDGDEEIMPDDASDEELLNKNPQDLEDDYDDLSDDDEEGENE